MIKMNNQIGRFTCSKKKLVQKTCKKKKIR